MQFHYLLGKSYEGDSLDEVGPLYEWEKESRVKVCFKPVKIFFPCSVFGKKFRKQINTETLNTLSLYTTSWIIFFLTVYLLKSI